MICIFCNHCGNFTVCPRCGNRNLVWDEELVNMDVEILEEENKGDSEEPPFSKPRGERSRVP